MKARIRSGGTQKIQVGSSLEFLKVGRKLEI
jgi:urease beta subunit